MWQACGIKRRIELGFSPRGLMTGRISTSPKYATGASMATFFEQVTARLAAVPGVTGLPRSHNCR
jgi:hypothetical protein